MEPNHLIILRVLSSSETLARLKLVATTLEDKDLDLLADGCVDKEQLTPFLAAYLEFEADCYYFWEPIGRAARRFWFRPWLKPRPTEAIADFAREKLTETEAQMIKHQELKANGYIHQDSPGFHYLQGRRNAFEALLKYLN